MSRNLKMSIGVKMLLESIYMFESFVIDTGDDESDSDDIVLEMMTLTVVYL